MFKQRLHGVGSVCGERSVGELAHGGPVESAQTRRAHVRLDERRAQLHHRRAVLDQLTTAHFQPGVLGLRLVIAVQSSSNIINSPQLNCT